MRVNCFLSFDDAPRKADLLPIQERSKLLIKNLANSGIRHALFYCCPRIHLGKELAKSQLDLYVQAGHYLGNHTLDHVALEHTTTLKYILSIAAADRYLKKMRGYHRIFRYPFLSKSKSDFKKIAVSLYLRLMGYRVNRLVLSNRDYLYNRKYCEAPEAVREGLRLVFMEQFEKELVSNLKKYKNNIRVGNETTIELNFHECDFTALAIGEMITCLRKCGVRVIDFDPLWEKSVNANS